MYLLHMTMTTGFQTFEADLRVDFRVRIAILKVSKRAPADKSLADTARRAEPPPCFKPDACTVRFVMQPPEPVGRPQKADPILSPSGKQLYQ